LLPCHYVKTNILKVPQLITQYLLQNKTLALQGLGSFTLDRENEIPLDNEKDEIRIPDRSISFKANLKLMEDEGLVTFIAKQSGKIKPLASADLDSFLELGKQMLNIGKPFVIEGLGFLQKHPANSDLEFTQGSIVIQKREDNSQRKTRKKESSEDDLTLNDENFFKTARKPDGGRKVIFGLLIFIGLGIIGWVGYFFYDQGRQNNEPVKKEEISPSSVIPVTDTLQSKVDSAQLKLIALQAEQQKKDLGFNIVLEISSKKRAFNRMAKLKELGHNIVMTTTDSIKFKLAIPITAPLSDSTRHRDSLRRYFARKVWVETN
jgi:hypothetical protein